MVTEHMFDLLTDVFKGVRSGLDLQVRTRACGGVMVCVCVCVCVCGLLAFCC